MANIFLDSNEIFPLAASNSTVFGRSGGSEALQIFDGVTGVTTDANLERIDLSGNLADHRFEATTGGLEISRDGQVVVTIPSLNGDLDLRASDGNVMFRQTGAREFTALDPGGSDGDQAIGEGAPVSLSVPIGDSGADSPGDAGDAPQVDSTVQLVDASNTDAGSGAFVFTDTQLPDDSNNPAVQAEILNFGADDQIQISRATDQSQVQVQSTTSEGGQTTIEYTTAEEIIFSVTLVGVSGSGFFTVNDFNNDPDLGNITFV